jgi:GT2 family glycosyltransferase
MTVSVMITTRNRAADLRRTCRMLRELNPAPLEILITADGCTDETVKMLKAEMLEIRSQKMGSERSDYTTTDDGRVANAETLKAEIKNLKVIVNEIGRGSVASRDRMMREAHGDLVLALDDDSYPEQTDCIARIATPFVQRPRLAVLGLPQRTDEYPKTLTQTDFGPTRPIRSFTNSGAVLRRAIYPRLPGFAPEFFHMYEEPDYTLQCVAAGYEVMFEPGLGVTIRHHYSGAARSELRNHQRHCRNEFWSTMMRCPLPQLPLLAVYRLFTQFRFACRYGGLGWVIREPVWWWQALRGMPRCLKNRRPVSWQSYKKWLALE